MAEKITIYEIAKAANVSIATISRAINPETRRKVSKETLKVIDDIIRQRGYTPNLAAKHLVKASYKTVGVILPHHLGIFSEDYYSQTLCGISDALLDSDYAFKLLMVKPGDKKWDQYSFKSAEGIDGLIVTHWHSYFSSASVFETLNIPCVIINDPEDKVKGFMISGDHFEGGRLAAQYLYDCGHRKMAVMTGPSDSTDSKLRLQGFESFLAEKGIQLPEDHMLCGHFQEDLAGKMIEKFFKQFSPSEITAIFCLNDNMAFGVIKKLAELGIACPGKISVLGYDDGKRAETFDPPLTTIRVPLYDLAKLAVQNLIHYLKLKSMASFYYQKHLLPVSLVERNTVLSISK